MYPNLEAAVLAPLLKGEGDIEYYTRIDKISSVLPFGVWPSRPSNWENFER
jgi:hypothetical protein